MRVAVTGGPRTGKSTLAAGIADELGVTPVSTDLVSSLDWSEGNALVATWFRRESPYVIEGVRVAHALRRWRDRNPGDAPPIDVLHVLTVPRVELSAGQRRAAPHGERGHDRAR